MGSIYDETVAVSRRTMVLFFAVDTSGSMEGAKIGALNSAIEDVIPEIRRLSEENADAQIKIAAIKFDTVAEWLTSAPVNSEFFTWNYLNAGGLTAFGHMCRCLNEKLSTKAFMNEAAGSFAPVIFLLSDGEPTDDYFTSLSQLKENNWFKKAVKVAVAVGDDANKEVLREFTGNSESVLTVYNPETLKKMIRFVSVTASQIASKSSSNAVSMEHGETMPDTIVTKQEEFNKALSAMELDDIDDDSLVW